MDSVIAFKISRLSIIDIYIGVNYFLNKTLISRKTSIIPPNHHLLLFNHLLEIYSNPIPYVVAHKN